MRLWIFLLIIHFWILSALVVGSRFSSFYLLCKFYVPTLIRFIIYYFLQRNFVSWRLGFGLNAFINVCTNFSWFLYTRFSLILFLLMWPFAIFLTTFQILFCSWNHLCLAILWWLVFSFFFIWGLIFILSHTWAFQNSFSLLISFM